MGIEASFLIKHVRPYGQDAYDMMCTPGQGTLSQWLLDHGVAQRDIDTAFAAWHITALLPINQQSLPAFIQSADLISQARWDELYETPASTILFMTGALLRELSFESGRHAGEDIDFLPHEYIPLAVTISSQPDFQPETYRAVEGMHVGINGDGNCVHFGGLIEQDDAQND